MRFATQKWVVALVLHNLWLSLPVVDAATLSETFTAHDTLVLNPRELTFFFMFVMVLLAATNYAMGRLQTVAQESVRSLQGLPGKTITLTQVFAMIMDAFVTIVMRVGAGAAAAFAITETVSAAGASWKVVITLAYTAFALMFFMMLAMIASMFHIGGVLTLTYIIATLEAKDLANGVGRRGTPAAQRRTSWSVAMRLRRELINATAAAFPRAAMDVTEGSAPGVVDHALRLEQLKEATSRLQRLEKAREEEVAKRRVREAEVQRRRVAQWEEDAADAVGADDEVSFSVFDLIPGVRRYRQRVARLKSRVSRGAALDTLLPRRAELELEQEAKEHAERMAELSRSLDAFRATQHTSTLINDVTLSNYLRAIFVHPTEAEHLVFRPASWALLAVFGFFLALRWVVSTNSGDVETSPVRDVTILVAAFGVTPCVIQIVVLVLAWQALVQYLAALDHDRRRGGAAQKRRTDDDEVSSRASSEATVEGPDDDDAVELRRAMHDPDALVTRKSPAHYFPLQWGRYAFRTAQSCYLCVMFFAAVLAVEYGYQPSRSDPGVVEVIVFGMIPVVVSLLIMPVTTLIFAVFNRTGPYLLHGPAYDTIVVPSELRIQWRATYRPRDSAAAAGATDAKGDASAKSFTAASTGTVAGGRGGMSDTVDASNTVRTADTGHKIFGVKSAETATMSADTKSQLSRTTTAGSRLGAGEQPAPLDPPTNPLAAAQAADVSRGGAKRVGFYFGDRRDEELHPFVPGSGVNLPGQRGHYSTPAAGSLDVDAFHNFAALESQRRVMEGMENRVRALVKLLKGERKYTAELARRAGVVKEIIVGRRDLPHHSTSGTPGKDGAVGVDEDLMWIVRPVEEALQQLQLAASRTRGDGEDPLPEDPAARRKAIERRKMRQLITLFTPEGAADLMSAQRSAPSFQHREALAALDAALASAPPRAASVTTGSPAPAAASILKSGDQRSRAGSESVRFALPDSTGSLEL